VTGEVRDPLDQFGIVESQSGSRQSLRSAFAVGAPGRHIDRYEPNGQYDEIVDWL
jgi:hypothetical protein